MLHGGILQNSWESPRFCGLHMEVKVYIWLILVYTVYFSDIILVYTLFAWSKINIPMRWNYQGIMLESMWLRFWMLWNLLCHKKYDAKLLRLNQVYTKFDQGLHYKKEKSLHKVYIISLHKVYTICSAFLLSLHRVWVNIPACKPSVNLILQHSTTSKLEMNIFQQPIVHLRRTKE